MRWQLSNAPLWIALGLLMPRAPAQAPPPSQLLYISREFPLPGALEKYREIEQDAARICAEVKCPNPYIGIESLTGPKEAWWINGFASEAAEKRVGDEYTKNRQIADALNGIAEQKRGLIGETQEGIATYRPELSHGPRWDVGQGRFLVITITRGKRVGDGTVFEAPDGTCFIVTSARTADEAEVKARTGSQIFAVRPYWSMPAKEWVAADPEFWKH